MLVVINAIVVEVGVRDEVVTEHTHREREINKERVEEYSITSEVNASPMSGNVRLQSLCCQ
jgi:hypothetical protein